jgi:hypothetical protein
MFEQTCTKCGKSFPRNANFCPWCGEPAAKGTVTCRFCGKEIPAAAKFCPHCRKETAGSERPTMVGNTWARDPNDFATRVEVDDLEGVLRRDLIIEPGTRAIILFDGRSLAGTIGPGRYTLRDLLDKLSVPSLRRRATALLVDTSEMDLALTINDVYTQDPLKIALDCHVAVEVADPLAFITNLLKSARSYTLAQLRAYLYDEIQDAAQECVGPRSAQDLHTNLALKQEFALHIEAHLDGTLRQTGLRFSRVRTVHFRHIGWDEQTQKQEELFLLLTREEAELEGRKLLFDVKDRAEIQAIAEETRAIAHFEQRVLLRERMRRAVMSDRFNELTGDREMEQFLRGIDRQKLIEDDEWDRIQRSIRWQREDELWDRQIVVEDRDRTRAHLLARLKLENEYELKQIELLQRADLTQAEQAFALKLERERVEGQQGIEASRQQFSLAQASQQAAFVREQTGLDNTLRREEQLRDEQQRLDLELQRAQTAARVEAIEREQDQLEFELAALMLEKTKAIRRRDEEERELMRLRTRQAEMEMDLVAEERRLNLRLVEAKQTHELEIAREAQTQQYELARMERLKDLPPSAIIAASGPDQGRIIADLQRTEAMKGMTEQQILAMMTENSPAAADALKEIAKASAEGRLAQEQVTLYERLLAQNQELLAERGRSSERETEAWRASMDKVQETAHKALDSQRDGMVEIARATSHPPAEQQSPTVVVTGPGGVPTVVGGAPGSAGGEAPEAAGGGVQCRRCGTIVPVGIRFCSNCGYEFFPTGREG